jgi:hypothetical protein
MRDQPRRGGAAIRRTPGELGIGRGELVMIVARIS